MRTVASTWRALVTALVVLAVAAPPGVARAGLPGGPFVVWVDLAATNRSAVDEAVRDVFNGDDKLCWGGDALLYMRKRPPGITDALVRRALVAREAAAQSRLRALMKKPFDEAPAFDGVIAYVDEGVPRLVSLSAAGRVRSDAVVGPAGAQVWLPSLCNVFPPIDHSP